MNIGHTESLLLEEMIDFKYFLDRVEENEDRAFVALRRFFVAEFFHLIVMQLNKD